MSRHLDRALLAAFDTLGDPARREALDHVARCSECRAVWLEGDPSRVFGLLAGATIPENALQGLSERVGRAVDELDAGRRPRPRVFGALAVAASAFLAAVVGAVLWMHEIPEADRVVRLDEVRSQQPLEDEVAGFRLVSSPGGEAQVLDLSIGETQVLMIFDEAIEL